MILQNIVDTFLNVLIWMANLLPIANACVLDGVDSAVSWFGYIYSATAIIVPWGDIWIMLEITLAVAFAQIGVQVIKFMASRGS